MRTDLFEPARAWLAQQPRMIPWIEGCALLSDQLNQWLADYSAVVCAKPLDERHPGHLDYQRRLWDCWGYHWSNAVEAAPDHRCDGWQVADCLRNNRDPVQQKNLGGNPLRDVVLADSVLHRDSRARTILYEECREFAMKFAASLGCSQDWEDLWHDCLIELVGDHGPGKLTSFQGHAGLQSWLGTVLRRFIWKRQREGRKTLSQPVEETGPPEEEVISQECLRLFRIWIDQALSDLSPRDRLLLFLRHVKALKGKEIAGIIGIHPGRISEGLKGARIHFRDLLERGTSSEARKQQEQQECLRHLLGGAHRFSFGQLLIEALRQFDPEGEES